MNMKKTIAAIAAGAVAVSAMATTVSAVESKTLNYNLTATLQNQINGKVTLKATFPNVTLTAGQEVVINAVGMQWNDKFVVTGNYIDTNKAIDPITFTRDIWSEGYSAQTEAMLSWDGAHIPVKAVNDGSPALIGSAASGAVEAVDPVVESATAVATIGGVKKTVAVNLGDFKLNQNVADVAAGATKAFQITSNGTAWAVDPATFGIDATSLTTADAADVIDITYTAPKAGVEGKPATEGTKANITVTVTMSTNDASWEDVNKKVQNHTYGITYNGVFGNATTSGKTDATAYKMPFMTNVPSAITGADNVDIVTYLQTANLLGSVTDKKAYSNVRAVLNDAVENYEGVTFTFNTAVQTVKFAIVSGTRYNPVIHATAASYDDAKKELAMTCQDKNDYKDDVRDQKNVFGQQKGNKDPYYPDCYIIGIYTENSWEGTDRYKEFGEHTYDWNYAPEATGFTGYDWGGTNLFAGALIINEHLTMSLSNAEYFDWTKTSVSFDWEAIMDNAATANSYATYIQSMKLATSAIWFWDSMDVVLTAGEADDVSADAGAEVDDATLDDEGDEEIDGDEEEDPAPVDDEEEDPAPVVDETPAPVVTNPPTGNASVALAVIPVALAAAAIVAKKRG